MSTLVVVLFVIVFLFGGSAALIGFLCERAPPIEDEPWLRASSSEFVVIAEMPLECLQRLSKKCGSVYCLTTIEATATAEDKNAYCVRLRFVLESECCPNFTNKGESNVET